MTAEQSERRPFGPPKDFGTGTQLLPAVRYFVERFKSAPWGFYVFITDGELHDLDAVLSYSVQLAREIAARRRNPLKFVLIGLGPNVNETQMTELDDLDSGTEVDLWDHKLAAEMRRLEEIFAEVVDKNARVADNGRILDPQGQVVRDFSHGGLPAFMEFEIAANAEYFALEVNGTRVNQPLRDGAPVPAGSDAPAPTAPRAGETVPPVGARNVKSAPAPAPPAPPADEPREMEDVNDADTEWRNLPLEMGQPGEQQTDLDLEQNKD